MLLVQLNHWALVCAWTHLMETHMYVYILWTEMCLMHAKGGLTIFIDRLQTKCNDWVLFNDATGGVLLVILQVV